MNDPSARPARLLLRQIRHGVLGTLSVRFPGYPAGSAVPFATDPAGRPVLLISALAAHTRNLDASPRVSLAVHQDDIVTAGRLCLFGTAATIDPAGPGAQRYLALFPDARAYAGFGDFRFVRIDPDGLHYIAGFGDIRWFDGDAVLLPPSPLESREADILDHMNTDHARALHDYWHHRFGAVPGEARMVAIDGDGFDVAADGRVARFEFPEPVADADAARRELVRMARESRAA